MKRDPKGRDWCDVATSHRRPAASRSWKKHEADPPLNSLEADWPWKHLLFKSVASKTVRKSISIFFPMEALGHY